MSTKLQIVKRQEVSDEALLDLALEIARQEEDSLQRLCDAVLSHDHKTAETLAKELKSHDAN